MRRHPSTLDLFTVSVCIAGSAAFVASAGDALIAGTNGWEGKISEYANPFDPDLSRDASETTVAYSNGWSMTSDARAVVNRVDGHSGGGYYGRIQLGGQTVPGPPSFMALQAPAAFNARTVIAIPDVWGGFSGTMPCTVKLGTGLDADWDATPALISGPGTAGSDTMIIANTNVTCDTVRIDYTQTAIYSGTAYADMNEVLALPDELGRLPATASQTVTTWGSAASCINLTRQSGWAYHSGGPARCILSFDLGSTQRVDALVFVSFGNADAIFQVTDRDTNAVANVTMTTGPVGWVLPAKFDDPWYTDMVRLDFGVVDPGVQQANFCEIMIMEDLSPPPPPSGTAVFVR